jgi:CheY-like chemotaxis protein
MAAMPAVFLSARVMPEDVQKGRDKGALYLTKPFVASALLGAVDKALAEVDAQGPDPGGW